MLVPDRLAVEGRCLCSEKTSRSTAAGHSQGLVVPPLFLPVPGLSRAEAVLMYALALVL